MDAVIPYGVPDAGTVHEKSPTPLFGYAGRLVPEKGVDWLLSAFATAFGPDSEARLVIIGDGPERGRLEALSTRLGIAHRTSFPGHKSRSETQRLLGPAWAQVTPSLWPEPFGLVTAEALMRGTPAIVSDQGLRGRSSRIGKPASSFPLMTLTPCGRLDGARRRP